MRTFQTIPQSEFVIDVRKRLRSIWSQANQLGNEDQTDKAAKNHIWVALSPRSVTVDGLPFSVPRYLHLDLGKQTQRNVARFRLHSHALRVETRSSAPGWEHHDGTCDKCGLLAIQDKTRSFPVSLHANVFVEASPCRLVSRFTTSTQNFCQSDWSFLFLQVFSELLRLKMSSISTKKIMIPIVLSQSV